MKVEVVPNQPQVVSIYPSWHGPGSDELARRMNPEHVKDVVEIFHSPLVGHFNWDYSSSDGQIRQLYKLGKELNWNADSDVDWSIQPDQSKSPFSGNNRNALVGWAPYDALSDDERVRLDWHSYGDTLSQFVHGEQGALLVASQLASCAPTYDAKLFAASQTFDEARHVEVFSRYLREKVGIMYPCNSNLKALIDKVLADERWDLKFIGMQIVIEGLALSAFQTIRDDSVDPLLHQIIQLVLRDESRHVAFGVSYLEEYYTTLSRQELEDRAQFAYEAVVVMRERLAGAEIYNNFFSRADAETARAITMDTEVSQRFRDVLFQRVIPNLKRIHLLTDRIKPKYRDLGLLKFEDATDDAQIDWAEISRPLPVYV